MTPKKKEAPTSSDTSSTNTSSSSSSSSSSSGSDSSSSSDTENTSTSGGKSGHATTDSDKKPTPKKKTSTSATKNKSEPPEPDKNKEKPTRSKTGQKGPLYSSESDESSKPNAKRKPPAKPKASATVTPLSKAKVVPKTTPKKPNPPRKVAQKSVKENEKKTNSVPKLEEQKKLKTKSIFSPDNSSDSDDQTSTPPPPKLTAMKTAASKSLKTKPKAKTTTVEKSRASSVSSNSSVSSESSDCDTPHFSVEPAFSDSVVPRWSSSSESSGGSGRGKTGRTNSRKSRSARKDKKTTGPPQLISDSDTGPIRKQTRSTNARRSKHVASSRVVSESDSDTVGSKTSASKSPVKKAGPKGPPAQRKPKGQSGNECSHLVEFQERRCPLEACDSHGHLGGKAEKHFTIEACPLYHRLTAQECKDNLVERRKRDEERKKATAALKASHISSPTPEQKAYRDKIKEMRSKPLPKEESDNESESSKEKQPDLTKFCNKYDLKIFQEAQAVASEMIEDELKQLANVRGTKYIEMGKYEMEVWYQSPYPEDFARLPKLYICEYCLRYMKSRNTLERHSVKCVWRHPPGEEVYRKDRISVWEVDGKRYKSYCQNLCLLAKFFLDHKTLYYDVEPFLFYVMTISDSEGCHTVGYFSKEKNSFLNYNVSCILTLPPYQRQGYGRLLIDFSYLLTRVENKVGSPEKPLSDLGLISYRSYWKDVLLEYLFNLDGKQLSIKDMTQEMAINAYDIVSTLQALGMMKYWKGKHIVLKKQDVIEEHMEKVNKRSGAYKKLDPECLKWTPFVAAEPGGAGS